LTMGPWPWKSVTDNKCVTTYPSNELALKKDNAHAQIKISQTIYFIFLYNEYVGT